MRFDTWLMPDILGLRYSPDAPRVAMCVHFRTV